VTPDEVLVFKGYDSTDPHAMNAMHTAFDNPPQARTLSRVRALKLDFSRSSNELQANHGQIGGSLNSFIPARSG
jgi:hypothetical protein